MTITLRPHSPEHPACQRGVTLLMSLIVLLLLALLGAWFFKTGTTNLRVVGNAQARQEAMAAANTAIELTISTTHFVTDPVAVAAAPVEVDQDGDGTVDFNVALAPAPFCYRAKQVSQSLDAADPAAAKCFVKAGEAPLCYDTEWAVRAVATDPTTGAETAVNQGISLRVGLDRVLESCP